MDKINKSKKGYHEYRMDIKIFKFINSSKIQKKIILFSYQISNNLKLGCTYCYRLCTEADALLFF